MCWVALDRGLRLAERCLRQAPERRWRSVREEIREAVADRRIRRGARTFRQAFGAPTTTRRCCCCRRSASSPRTTRAWSRTVDAVARRARDGRARAPLRLRRRHARREGAFLACSFWLAECLAGQDRLREAREVFERALAAGNDLGLFSEEYDPGDGLLLGNFPRASRTSRTSRRRWRSAPASGASRRRPPRRRRPTAAAPAATSGLCVASHELRRAGLGLAVEDAVRAGVAGRRLRRGCRRGCRGRSPAGLLGLDVGLRQVAVHQPGRDPLAEDRVDGRASRPTARASGARRPRRSPARRPPAGRSAARAAGACAAACAPS